ncbi:hypothetical protein D9M71_496040 [compost metagenome]
MAGNKPSSRREVSKSNMKCRPCMKCPVVRLYPSRITSSRNSSGIMIRRLFSNPATTPRAITSADSSMNRLCHSTSRQGSLITPLK